MTIESHKKATELIGHIQGDTNRLALLKEYTFADNVNNYTKKEHCVYLEKEKVGVKSFFLDYLKKRNGDGKHFFLEVLNREMVAYLVQQEINMLEARVTKNKIILSKL